MGKARKAFGEFIKEARKERYLTQVEVSEMMHISQQAYSKYERGERKIDIEMMLEIAEVLEFSLSDFFDDYAEAR